MRRLFRPLAILSALGALSLAAGCGGDSPSTPGSIGMSISPAGGSAVQGTSTSVGVTLTRTNFTGDVSIAMSGAPAGVTVSPAVTTLSGSASSATLSVSVGASTAAGSYPMTVTASGSGVESKSATYTLTVTAAPVPSYTMTLAPVSASVSQGTSAATTVTLARSNFTGGVTLAATGVPSGATVTYAQPGTTSSGTVTINTGTAAQGTYNLTITGSATGLTDVTAPFALTITPPPTPTTVTYTFCGSAPVWFGYQSGTSGTWTTVAPGANNTFTFTVTGPSGLAYVAATNGDASTSGYYTSILYGTPADLQASGTNSCSSGTKTVNGSVSGVDANNQVEVNLSRAYTYAMANGAWTITGVPNGTYDLLASLLGSNDIASKVIIRRAQNPADNATLPVLDFSGSEAIATTPMTLTFTGLAATQPVVFAQLESATGTVTTLSSTMAALGSTQSAGVPLTSLAASDMQSVFAYVPEGSSLRGLISYFRAPGNKTFAIGSAVGTPTASTISTTPYARPRLSVASQPAYGAMAVAEFQQGGSLAAASDRVVDIYVTAGYYGSTPATWTMAVPDFSAASGFNSIWELAPGVTTNWAFYGYSANFFTTTPSDGMSIQFAAYQASMVPASAGSFAPGATLNVLPSPEAMMTRFRKQQRSLPNHLQRVPTPR